MRCWRVATTRSGTCRVFGGEEVGQITAPRRQIVDTNFASGATRVACCCSYRRTPAAAAARPRHCTRVDVSPLLIVVVHGRDDGDPGRKRTHDGENVCAIHQASSALPRSVQTVAVQPPALGACSHGWHRAVISPLVPVCASPKSQLARWSKCYEIHAPPPTQLELGHRPHWPLLPPPRPCRAEPPPRTRPPRLTAASPAAAVPRSATSGYLDPPTTAAAPRFGPVPDRWVPRRLCLLRRPSRSHRFPGEVGPSLPQATRGWREWQYAARS